MTSGSRMTLPWPAAIAAAALLVAIGAGTVYLVQRPRPPAPSGPAAQSPGAAAEPAPAAIVSTDAPDLAVTLTPDAIERAGIVLAPVTSGTEASSLRVPGLVEANAYKQVAVTPLVGGRVVRVLAELGQPVRRGQAMAEIFSPELADAETRYVSARAELEAHERELERAEKLVQIGAASRQELERLHAEHTAKSTAVASARSRLELLGLSPASIESLEHGKDVAAITTVPAPIAGVVTERSVNAGVNVESSARLFTVVDLSTVWVTADVFEKDFSRVRVGSAARVTTRAYPDEARQGRVSYTDPQVNPETRTAKMRIEVANPAGHLRLGMYADVTIEEAAPAAGLLIPRAAVQNVGNRTVVYVADSAHPGRFTERDVTLGDANGDRIQIVTGLAAGDMVVAEGSFSVRAERERLGRPRIQEARVLITPQGFEPDTLTLTAGTPAKITFVRTTDKTCATEIVVASLNIRRPLPINQPVAIEFPPGPPGEIGFACGMHMLRGTILVR
jgi:membrane fusion protein, heavy metal efflux system